jgi:hypothetical protein
MSTRVAAADSALLQLSAHGHNLASTSAVVLEGPAPSLDDIRERVVQLLPHFPRLEAMPVPVPFDLQRPVWARVPDFRLDDHVGTLTVDPPGGAADVERLISDLVNRPLDTRRSLWELWLVTGLRRERWLLAARLHLALVDELRSADFFSAVLLPQLELDTPRPLSKPPNPVRLIGDAVRDLATSPYEQVRAAGALFRRFRRPPRLPSASPADLAHRRVILKLNDLQSVRAGLGGSVNDVLVSVLMAGIMAAEPERRTPIRVALPFAVRSLSQPGSYDNQIAVDHVELAMGDKSAQQRYRTVSEVLDRFARDNLAVGGKTLTRLSGFPPYLLLALGARACAREQADVSFVNAPGGSSRVTALRDRRVVDGYAVAPHPPGVHWSATAMSYGGAVTLSLTGTDSEALDAAAAAIPGEMAELAALAASHPGAASSRENKKPQKAGSQTEAGARGGDTAKNRRKK